MADRPRSLRGAECAFQATRARPALLVQVPRQGIVTFSLCLALALASFASASLAAPMGRGAVATPPPARASAPSSQSVSHAHHRFTDTERYVKMFEDPARAEYQKPQ